MSLSKYTLLYVPPLCAFVCDCFLFLSPLRCHLQQLVEHGYNCQCRTTARFCCVAAWECPWQRDGWQQAVSLHEPLPDSQHPQQQGQVHHHQQSCTCRHHVSPSPNLRPHSRVWNLFDRWGDTALTLQPRCLPPLSSLLSTQAKQIAADN